jgi:hypothetical protein
MTPLTFVARYLGKSITSSGGIGGEFVDLANQWLFEAYGDRHVYRNAIDWARLGIPNHRWAPNAARNAPSPGALVVWGPNAHVGTGPNGHIALALAADSMHMVTADLNWPEGAPTALRLHTYDGVLGWQAPTP